MPRDPHNATSAFMHRWGPSIPENQREDFRDDLMRLWRRAEASGVDEGEAAGRRDAEMKFLTRGRFGR